MKRHVFKTVSISDILNERSSFKREECHFDKSSSSLENEKSVQDLIRTISQNTLSSTHRIFDYCDKSEACGVNLGKQLAEQDKRLGHIGKDLDKINENLGDVENNLNSLREKGLATIFLFLLEVISECCCCCFCWCCTKSPEEENESSSRQDSISARKSKSLNLGLFSKIKSRWKRKRSSRKSKSVLFSSASSKLNESNPVISDDSFLSNRFDSKLKIKNLYDSTVKPVVSFTSSSIRQTSFDKSIMDLNSLLSNNLKSIDTKLNSLHTIASGIGNELHKQNSKIELHTNKAEVFTNNALKANRIGKVILKKDKSTLDKVNKNGLNVLP